MTTAFGKTDSSAGVSDKMAQFMRLWVAQFGHCPSDWQRKNDPASSYGLFREFIEDDRTGLETCRIALEGFADDPPPFKQFKNAYFRTLRPGGGIDVGKCDICRGVRYLYAVTGTGTRRDGRRGTVITGPGHKAVPVSGAAVVTVICRCHPSAATEKSGEAFATDDRRAAEAHAAECQRIADGGKPAPERVQIPEAWESVSANPMDRLVDEVAKELAF